MYIWVDKTHTYCNLVAADNLHVYFMSMLQEQLSASLKELETFDKSVMHRLFPDVSVKEKQVGY